MPITAPPAANAPTIPTVRPRTIGVEPTNRQPAMICLRIDGTETLPLCRGISRSEKIVIAETRNVTALMYSARLACWRWFANTTPEIRASTENVPAATGAEPYVEIRLIWLAFSSRSFGTRFGTEASLAGIQNSVTTSTRKVAPYSQSRRPTSGIDRNRLNRRMSAITIVVRRSKRSATAPASGPKTSAGSSLTTRTPPIA
ncbi:hypothetical protein GCM10029978_008400 [Actinoallomurus acanthiterrae]